MIPCNSIIKREHFWNVFNDLGNDLSCIFYVDLREGPRGLSENDGMIFHLKHFWKHSLFFTGIIFCNN